MPRIPPANKRNETSLAPYLVAVFSISLSNWRRAEAASPAQIAPSPTECEILSSFSEKVSSDQADCNSDSKKASQILDKSSDRHSHRYESLGTDRMTAAAPESGAIKAELPSPGTKLMNLSRLLTIPASSPSGRTLFRLNRCFPEYRETAPEKTRAKRARGRFEMTDRRWSAAAFQSG
jgi:hypothetical protein